jgi:hypothetical protein
MLTYEKLSRKPHAFRFMTGLNIEEFDQVFVELEYYHLIPIMSVYASHSFREVAYWGAAWRQ